MSRGFIQSQDVSRSAVCPLQRNGGQCKPIPQNKGASTFCLVCVQISKHHVQVGAKRRVVSPELLALVQELDAPNHSDDDILYGKRGSCAESDSCFRSGWCRQVELNPGCHTPPSIIDLCRFQLGTSYLSGSQNVEPLRWMRSDHTDGRDESW